jgi:hypothetical protein
MTPDLDSKLRDALRPVPPPAGFTLRVLKKLPRQNRPPSWKPRLLIGLAAALTIVVLLVVRVQVQRARHEKAQRDLVYALHLTANKLNVVQSRLARSSLSAQLTRMQRNNKL